MKMKRETTVIVNDKPSYCREYHKWLLRIWPGGRNKWEIVPEDWQPHTAQEAALALMNGECAWVEARVLAEQAWWSYQERMRWRDGR